MSLTYLRTEQSTLKKKHKTFMLSMLMRHVIDNSVLLQMAVKETLKALPCPSETWDG